MRALQQTPEERESEVASLVGFKRLKQVTESPIFGLPSKGGQLLSTGEDALSMLRWRYSSHWYATPAE